MGASVHAQENRGEEKELPPSLKGRVGEEALGAGDWRPWGESAELLHGRRRKRSVGRKRRLLVAAEKR
jgi:hypothetical protein